MNNPFKKGDRVSVKIKGQVVEAFVHQTWQEEVQVRTLDRKLHWRVPKTVTLIEAAPPVVETVASASQPSQELAAEPAGEPPAAQGGSGSTMPHAPAAELTGGDQATPARSQPRHSKKASGGSVPYKRSRSRGNKRRKI